MSQLSSHKLPSDISEQLRSLWLRSRGAAEAAAAAQQVAKVLIEAYQAKFADCLAMLGVDTKARWWIDFKTGEVHEGDPPSQVDDGGDKLLSISPESNTVQTNGRSP